MKVGWWWFFWVGSSLPDVYMKKKKKKILGESSAPSLVTLRAGTRPPGRAIWLIPNGVDLSHILYPVKVTGGDT